MEEFPIYSGGNMSEYLERLEKFGSNVNKEKYNVILKFVQRWFKNKDKKYVIRSLEDFRNVSQFALPNEEKCKDVMEKYATDICNELDIKYKFDEENVINHYKELKKAKNKKKDKIKHSKEKPQSIEDLAYMVNSTSTNKKNNIENAAHDFKYPFRSETITFLRTILNTIDYKLVSRRVGNNILWDIKKNKSINVQDRYESISKTIKDNSVSASDDDSCTSDNSEDTTDKKKKRSKKKTKGLSSRELEMFQHFSKLE